MANNIPQYKKGIEHDNQIDCITKHKEIKNLKIN